jgi:hypothetical protein
MHKRAGIKQWMVRRGSEVLGTITIAQKSESDELMAADFLAHTYGMLRADNPLLLEQSPPQDEPDNRPIGRAGLTYLDFREETFGDLKDAWANERQAAMDAWRVARDAKRALAASSRASVG